MGIKKAVPAASHPQTTSLIYGISTFTSITHRNAFGSFQIGTFLIIRNKRSSLFNLTAASIERQESKDSTKEPPVRTTCISASSPYPWEQMLKLYSGLAIKIRAWQ